MVGTISSIGHETVVVLQQSLQVTFSQVELPPQVAQPDVDREGIEGQVDQRIGDPDVRVFFEGPGDEQGHPRKAPGKKIPSLDKTLEVERDDDGRQGAAEKIPKFPFEGALLELPMDVITFQQHGFFTLPVLPGSW